MVSLLTQCNKKIVHHIHPTRNVCDGTAAGLETIEQPAMKLRVRRIGKYGCQMNAFSIQSHNRVTPSHDQHILAF